VDTDSIFLPERKIQLNGEQQKPDLERNNISRGRAMCYAAISGEFDLLASAEGFISGIRDGSTLNINFRRTIKRTNKTVAFSLVVPFN
jgi:hypothetical protein